MPALRRSSSTSFLRSAYEAARAAFFALNIKTNEPEAGSDARTASRQRRLMVFRSAARTAIFLDTAQLYRTPGAGERAKDKERHSPCTCLIAGTASTLLRRCIPVLTLQVARGLFCVGALTRGGRFWSLCVIGIHAYARASSFWAGMFVS